MNNELEILHLMPDAIYITDIKTKELLYMNQPALDLFHMDDFRNAVCYTAIYGLNSPCAFCTTDLLSEDYWHISIFTDLATSQCHQRKSRLIQFNERVCRLDIVEIDDQSENAHVQLQHAVTLDNVLLNCLKELHKAANLGTVFQRILNIIGVFMEADRAYLNYCGKNDSLLTEEWKKPEALSILPFIDCLTPEDISRWSEYLMNHSSLYLESIQLLEDQFKKEYDICQKLNIQSCTIIPLITEGELIGCLSLDNPSKEKAVVSTTLLATLSYFLASTLVNHMQKQQLTCLSYIDPLTGLPNRTRYNEDLESLSGSTPKKIGILYLDLNGLKDINDKGGHSEGDKTLLTFAALLRTYFPLKNIYRVGGDEFVVICTSISEEVFHQKIRGLKDDILLKTHYGASLGSVWSVECDDLYKLISTADGNMYLDKKNFYRHTTTTGLRYRRMNDQFIEMTAPDTLQRLLDQNKFVIYYQPKVSFLDRHLVGAEALVRYVDDQNQIVSPDRFIPLLEDVRLIHMIDLFVFEHVCRSLIQWKEQGRELYPISVNFSRFTLNKHDFLPTLLSIWRKYDLPLKLIEIEITEGGESDISADILTILHELKKYGFTISIDDFGVKYANLYLFTSMGFDVLKIDKSLLNDIPTNEKSRTVIRAISSICKKLNILLVVEGVETETQFRILKDLECDAAQGYLFSKPIPEEQYMNNYLALQKQ